MVHFVFFCKSLEVPYDISMSYVSQSLYLSQNLVSQYSKSDPEPVFGMTYVVITTPPTSPISRSILFLRLAFRSSSHFNLASESFRLNWKSIRCIIEGPYLRPFTRHQMFEAQTCFLSTCFMGETVTDDDYVLETRLVFSVLVLWEKLLQMMIMY